MNPLLDSASRPSVGDSDDAEDAELLSTEKPVRRQRWERTRRLSLLLQAMNVAMFLFSLSWFGFVAYERFLVSNPLARRLSVYSPLLDAFELKVQTVQTKYWFFPGKDSPPTRHLPNAVDDKMWAEFTNSRVFPITRDELVRLGADPETSIQLPNDIWGLGEDMYAAALDVHHLLHCVDVLRRQTYFAHYGREPMRHNWTLANASTREIHLAHCIDILAQAIQCVPNLDLHTFIWLDGHPKPYPNFSLRKQCVTNFDELTKWRTEHGIDQEEFRNRTVRPEGQKSRPSPDAFYIKHHEESLNHVNGANPDEDFAL